MKKLLFWSFLVGLTLILTACGTTNCLSWAKPAGSTTIDNLDQARIYIDNAEYSKAESLLNDYLKNHSSSREANILYAQAELGLADVDLASIISALSEETPTPSLCKLANICAATDRDLVYDAAEKFIAYQPTDPSDKVISAFCGMIAFTSILHDTYDTADNGLIDDTGDLAPTDLAKTRWDAMANKENNYLDLAFNSLASLSGDKTVQDTASSMNTVLTYIDANITAGTQWTIVKTLLLGF
jgi:hypothetical protein